MASLSGDVLTNTSNGDSPKNLSQAVILKEDIPVYMIVVVLVALGVYLLVKVCIVIAFIAFTICKVRPANKQPQKESDSPSKNLEKVALDIKAHLQLSHE